MVVPADAGTHTARILVSDISGSHLEEQTGLGLWVPASAGTTKIGYRRAGLSMYHVYILASRRHGTLYIGVTNSLLARLAQHRSGKGSEFVQKYKVYRLVYVESYDRPDEAIAREKQLKRWKRDWKIELIERDNLEWCDLGDLLD